MKISIVIPTLGRQTELRTLLESLQQQAQENLEVLVIDQNPPGYLDSLLTGLTIRDLRHYRVDFKSISRARNFGLAHAHGELVNFCDDDATLLPDAVSTFMQAFTEHPALDMASFKAVDPVTGRPCMVKFHIGATAISYRNSHSISIEFAQVWRSKSLHQLHGYEESLGLGSYFGAEEGLDLLLRGLDAGLRMYYFDQTLFCHPEKADAPLQRYYSYARGTGRVFYLHRTNPQALLLMLHFVVRSVAGSLLFLPWQPRKAMRYMARSGGFIMGAVMSVVRHRSRALPEAGRTLVPANYNSLYHAAAISEGEPSAYASAGDADTERPYPPMKE